MRTVITSSVVAAALAGLAFAGAGQASAEPPNGSYTRTNGDTKIAPFEVILTPCGPDCTHYALASNPATGHDYHLRGGRWVADPSEFVPEDSFDKNSLVGTITLLVPTMGGSPRPVNDTYTLVKNG